MILASIKWLLLALGGLVVTLVHVVFFWLISLFAIRTGNLPKYLAWFQTPDNPAIGDGSFQEKQMPWTKKLPARLSRYFLAMGWALRNPAYGYDKWAGTDIPVEKVRYVSTGAELVDIFRDSKGKCIVIEGTITRKLEVDTLVYFQYTRLHRWFFNPNKAYRVSIGWTLTPWMISTGHINLNTTINPWLDCTND